MEMYFCKVLILFIFTKLIATGQGLCRGLYWSVLGKLSHHLAQQLNWGYQLVCPASSGFCKGQMDKLNRDITGTTTTASFVGVYNHCHSPWDGAFLLIYYLIKGKRQFPLLFSYSSGSYFRKPMWEFCQPLSTIHRFQWLTQVSGK